jgi:hypothetical protein
LISPSKVESQNEENNIQPKNEVEVKPFEDPEILEVRIK